MEIYARMKMISYITFESNTSLYHDKMAVTVYFLLGVIFSRALSNTNLYHVKSRVAFWYHFTKHIFFHFILDQGYRRQCK